MVGKRLILILGDQLSHNLSALQAADKTQDIVIMAETMHEGTYVPHHPQKIILILSAMRHFAKSLQDAGWNVVYCELNDPKNTGEIGGEIERIAKEHNIKHLVYTEPSEWRLRNELSAIKLRTTPLEDTRFIMSHAKFNAWVANKKSLRMEFFYREMRRKTGLLMNNEKPIGGKWNYDLQNRKKPQKTVCHSSPKTFIPNDTTRKVMQMVSKHFSTHFGQIDNFSYAVTHEQAQCALDHFVQFTLPYFGDYQDAMLQNEPFMYHALIAAYLNIGLLDPIEVCKTIEKAYYDGLCPLNSAEGFIRQIIGWREFVRGIYFSQGPNYINQNYLGAKRKLPNSYWGKTTAMNCIASVVKQTNEFAYAHHIQRLMITGNFALLTGIDPIQVHEWYLSVYIDAFEWVEAPNTIGMSQFADGGIIASKPYVSSGAYINRMSNYCKSCKYNVSEKLSDDACPFNALYWDFLNRHHDLFATNPRMAQIYKNWDRQSDQIKTQTLEKAAKILTAIDCNDGL